MLTPSPTTSQRLGRVKPCDGFDTGFARVRPQSHYWTILEIHVDVVAQSIGDRMCAVRAHAKYGAWHVEFARAERLLDPIFLAFRQGIGDRKIEMSSQGCGRTTDGDDCPAVFDKFFELRYCLL